MSRSTTEWLVRCIFMVWITIYQFTYYLPHTVHDMLRIYVHYCRYKIALTRHAQPTTMYSIFDFLRLCVCVRFSSMLRFRIFEWRTAANIEMRKREKKLITLIYVTIVYCFMRFWSLHLYYKIAGWLVFAWYRSAHSQRITKSICTRLPCQLKCNWQLLAMV